MTQRHSQGVFSKKFRFDKKEPCFAHMARREGSFYLLKLEDKTL
jgi:hypothetical protein